MIDLASIGCTNFGLSKIAVGKNSDYDIQNYRSLVSYASKDLQSHLLLFLVSQEETIDNAPRSAKVSTLLLPSKLNDCFCNLAACR